MNNFELSPVILLLLLLLLVAFTLVAILFFKLRSTNSQNQQSNADSDKLRQDLEKIKSRYSQIIDVEVEKQRVLSEIEFEKKRLDAEKVNVSKIIENERKQMLAQMEAIKSDYQRSIQTIGQQKLFAESELINIQSKVNALLQEFKKLDEESNIMSFGFYKPRYSFANSKEYQLRLEIIYGRQKQMIKEKTAAVCQTEWTVNGSRTEGRKSINQTLKLILRAFNGECDAAIAKVKYNNVHVMENRILKAWEAINNLASVQTCHITNNYLNLKLEELYLAHEYEEKLQEEKEEQRRIKEQMREEEIALREIEKVRLDAERQEKMYQDLLIKARTEAEQSVGEKQLKLLAKIEELQRRLAEAQANKERAIARAQMTRSGHVYIISNIGSFGEDIFKIGMTRRLDPMERVKELGDASVPFQFDVHAVIFCEDAPALENKLHKIFHNRRVNQINERKEFFKVTIDEIAQAVKANHGEIVITQLAEAAEYRKTVALLTQNNGAKLEV